MDLNNFKMMTVFMRFSGDPELMLQGKKSKNCFISPF